MNTLKARLAGLRPDHIARYKAGYNSGYRARLDGKAMDDKPDTNDLMTNAGWAEGWEHAEFGSPHEHLSSGFELPLHLARRFIWFWIWNWRSPRDISRALLDEALTSTPKGTLSAMVFCKNDGGGLLVQRAKYSEKTGEWTTKTGDAATLKGYQGWIPAEAYVKLTNREYERAFLQWQDQKTGWAL